MRIGFDARMIGHPGIGRYIRCLIEGILEISEGEELVLFGDPDKLRVFKGAEAVEWKAPIYSVREQYGSPYGKAGIDILHVPHFNIPIKYKGKLVVTVHDLIYLLFPRAVSNPAARWYAGFMFSRIARRADAVIAVSEHTKSDMARLFGAENAERIRVIHEAVSADFRKIENEEEIKELRVRYDINKPFILYVGSVKPHKNVVTLLEVFNRIRAYGLDIQLVIAGRWDTKENRIRKEVEKENVKYLGEVPSEDLHGLYSAARALVHLSLYEGFGLTVLEAMKCGTPAVVSSTSSLPEVAGEAALTVNPLNIGQITDTVYNVLINNTLRDGMVEAGYRRVKEFSWRKAAAETLALYKES
ncbi:MAG: glycosyltransferase [Candidatus Omnitrophica bacterium]|nr:glycosyltransferase [Candidatus Omnitrophota bacterium]